MKIADTIADVLEKTLLVTRVCTIKINENWVQIMSAHFMALRDGNHTTIPADCLPEDYQVPSFRG